MGMSFMLNTKRLRLNHVQRQAEARSPEKSKVCFNGSHVKSINRLMM